MKSWKGGVIEGHCPFVIRLSATPEDFLPTVQAKGDLVDLADGARGWRMGCQEPSHAYQNVPASLSAPPTLVLPESRVNYLK